MGLPWILFIDIAFFTILIATAIAFGGWLRHELASVLPKLRRLGNIAHLVGVLGAVIIGYFACDDIVLPLLYSQGVKWAYKLIFGVLVSGVSASVAFELLQTVLIAKRSAGSFITLSESSTPEERGAGVANCRKCGASLPLAALFCSRCETKVEEAASDTVGVSE